MLDDLISTLTPFGPLATVLALLVAALISARRLIRKHTHAGGRTRFREQMISVIIALAGVLLVVLVLPVSETMRGQLVNLFGLALTAMIALSSTTVVANAMGGLMIRFMGTLRTGDMVTVGDEVGRITEFGLFHTEIQNETRDLITIPNLHLISHPVRAVRQSGTFLTASVSLGYDVHHKLAETLLLKAATEAGLDKPAVHIRELHDHAVEYRVFGFAEDTSLLYTLRSQLHANILDSLQDEGVEIVSPSFMYQRPQPDGTRTIPRKERKVEDTSAEQEAVEELAFDKASQAEAVENLGKEQGALLDEIKGLKGELDKAEEQDQERLQREISVKERRAERLASLLESALGEEKSDD